MITSLNEPTINTMIALLLIAVLLTALLASLLGWFIRSWTTESSWPAMLYIAPILLALGFAAGYKPWLLLALPLAIIIAPLFALATPLMNLVEKSLAPADHFLSWLIHRFAKYPESRAVIERLLRDDAIESGQAEMLIGVVDLHDMTAAQVMTAKPALDFIGPDNTVDEAIDLCLESGHGRLPVLAGQSHDEIVGIVYLHDLVHAYRDQASLQSIIQEALIVPEQYLLDKLMSYLKTARKTVAMVVDEYGRPVGMVTVEDIIEEIVGEIDDETDKPLFWAGKAQIPGHISLDDLPQLTGGEKHPVTSLGGLVFHLLGHLPEVGESVDYRDNRLTVAELSGNRIALVHVEKIEGLNPGAHAELDR